MTNQPSIQAAKLHSNPPLSAGSVHRQTELARIAYTIVSEKGFEGLRVREVAARAGINAATLHYYFPTKEALVQAVVQYLMEQFATAHAPESKVGDDNPLQLLESEFADLKYRMKYLPDLFIVAGELELRSLRDPTIAAFMHRMYQAWREHIEIILQKGIEQNVFQANLDVLTTAIAISAMFKGFSYEASTRSEADVDKLFLQIKNWLTTDKRT